jgi:hypothetical protein
LSMMPWAADRCAGEESVDERSVIMRAMSADGKNFRPAARHKDIFVFDMADEHSSVSDRRKRNALGEVWPCGLGFILCHARYSEGVRLRDFYCWILDQTRPSSGARRVSRMQQRFG